MAGTDNKQVLILCAHRPNRSPSQRYRFEQYLPYLEQNGFKFTWSFLLNEKTDPVFYSEGNLLKKVRILLGTFITRCRDIFRFRRYDIVFIQREALFLGSSYFEKKAFQSGCKVIFDFDDSIWLADTSPGNKKFEWIKRPEKFFDNLKYAHCVIAGNTYLAEKAKSINKNTVIIPTTIDTGVHVSKPELRNKQTLVIGWSGSISTIKHFNLLKPVLDILKNKYGKKIKFKIIADRVYDHNEEGYEFVKWSAHNEVNELNTFDIGLMPLPDDEWAKGKCGLKGLSYMACGIPTIMSPVGVNNEIIQHTKNGFLASTDEEWLYAMTTLIEDPLLRRSVGEEGRRTVLEKYSVEANREKYLQVFNGLNRRVI